MEPDEHTDCGRTAPVGNPNPVVSGSLAVREPLPVTIQIPTVPDGI
jgi:hypothetical protein